MNIGILALQGAFAEHEAILSEIGVSTFQIRQCSDLSRSLDGLIIPGGESTVQGKLLRELNMFSQLKELITDGLPVFGTCAGLLLLAGKIENDEQTHLATMNITAVRNAYGRQLGSFHTNARFAESESIPMTFIRAPYIKNVGDGVTVLSTVDGKIVAARQNNQLVTSFHPELTRDLTVHKYFVNMIKSISN